MGRVAQDWLVLTVLTDHSATALGIVTGLQFLPFLILAPFAGMLVDRFPKRRILFLTQTALLVTALLLALLTAAGVVELWHVYALAFLQGVATAVDNPARQTFVSEMVDTEHLPNAVALNSASFNLGRLIGPAVAGLVIAWFGIAPALFVNAATFLFVLAALLRMNTATLTPSPRARGKGQIREGLRYVKGRPDLVLVMALVFVLGTFGMNFQLTMALMATKVFDKGPGEYGLLGSIMAVGSLDRGPALGPSAASPPAGPARRSRRVHGLDGAAGDRSDLRALRGLPRADRPVRPHRPDDGQRHGPDQRRPRHARPGHGAVHGDLHGRHARRSAGDRLDRRRLGAALDHRHRHGRRGPQPGRGGPLVRPTAECRGDHPDPASAPTPHPARLGGPGGLRGDEVSFKFRHRVTVAALLLLVVIAVVAAIVNR